MYDYRNEVMIMMDQQSERRQLDHRAGLLREFDMSGHCGGLIVVYKLDFSAMESVRLNVGSWEVTRVTDKWNSLAVTTSVEQ